MDNAPPSRLPSAPLLHFVSHSRFFLPRSAARPVHLRRHFPDALCSILTHTMGRLCWDTAPTRFSELPQWFVALKLPAYAHSCRWVARVADVFLTPSRAFTLQSSVQTFPDVCTLFPRALGAGLAADAFVTSSPGCPRGGLFAVALRRTTELQFSPRGVSHAVDVFVTSRRATPRVSPAPHTALRSCRLWSWVRSTRSAFVSSAAPLAPKPVVRGDGALTATPCPLVQFGTQRTRKLTVTKGARCCRIYRRPLGNPKGHARN